MTSSSGLATWAVVSATVGGVLIILGGLMGLLMAPMMSMMMGSSGMMSMGIGMAVWGLVTGGATLFAAYRLHHDSRDARPWGIALLVAGVLSFPAMGGFMLGAVLTIAAGVLAIFASTRAPAEPQDAAQP